MPYKETETVKLYYTMGDVSKMFGVNLSLIRFWEKEFEIIQPKKNKKGNRLFTQQDIDNFREIYSLVKQKGYTLQGAKVKLKERENPPEVFPKEALIKKLQTIKKSLQELKEGV